MLLRSGPLGLCAAVCVLLLLAAAAPFASLPADSPVHTNLASYETLGLLGELGTPAAGLSRLEAALLVQRALEAYAIQRLGGGGDETLDSMLAADCAELAEELALLGVKAAATLDWASPMQAVQVVALEAQALPSTAPAVSPEQAVTAAACCPDCGEALDECTAEPELSITPYGDLALQLRAGRVAIATGGNLDTSDLTMYWGEVGVDLEHGQLGGHFSALLDSGDANIALHEAYAEWKDAANGWVLRGGRVVQPLGVRPTVFPSYSAASDLVYTTASAIGGEIRTGNATLSAYAFNPKVEVNGQNDTLSDYSVNIELSNASDDTPDYYRLAAGMTSHLAATDIRLAGDGPLTGRVSAGSLLGEYVWGCGRHRMVGEYSWAFKAFDPADLDADGDGAGDKPTALNLEYIHTADSGQEFGVRHERTSQFADYAQTRWGMLYGQRLNEFATFRLELSRGTYGDFTTIDAEHDTQLNAEVRIIF